MPPGTAAGWTLLGGAVLATGFVSTLVWRRRSRPTARPLFATATALFASAIAQFLVLGPGPIRGAASAATGLDGVEAFWLRLAFAITLLAAGFWVLFAIEYTGRGDRLRPFVAAGVGVVWLVFLGVAAFVPLPDEPGIVEGWLGGGLFFLSALVVLGAMLVLEAGFQRNAVDLRESALLAGGAVTFVFGPAVAGNLDRPLIVSGSLLAASGLFAAAVGRGDSFETLPVARIAGRDRLVADLPDAIVVVDRDGRIRDLNPAAETVFGVSRADCVGDPLETLLEAPVEAIDDPVRRRTDDGTVLAVTATRVTGARGRRVGHALVCRDVTGRQRRERRLRVLSRLLTDAVGERMTAVAEEADALADRSEADATRRVGAEIASTTTNLQDLVARTRDIERALAAEGDGRCDVTAVLRDLEVDGSPRVAVATPEERIPADVDPTVLETALETIVADAVKHARRTVDVRVLDLDRGPEVHVVDDGPATGRELAVKIAGLAIEDAGGTVSASDAEPDRHRVVVSLPRGDRT